LDNNQRETKEELAMMTGERIKEAETEEREAREGRPDLRQQEGRLKTSADLECPPGLLTHRSCSTPTCSG
jgi:hypothetical protein